jgi:putative ABC transport system permease protein
MSRFFSDVRFSLRLLKRSPGFAAAVLGLLVLGIGATTAMFSVIQALVLRPLPYPRAQELSVVWSTQWEGPESTSVADFTDWHELGTQFESIAVTDAKPFSLAMSGEKPTHVFGAVVSGDFFPAFGLPAERGRLLGPDDMRADAPHVAVLSTTLWRERFGARPDILGTTIKLDGEAFTVVGVAERHFRFISVHHDGGDVWVPLRLTHHTNDRYDADQRGDRFLQVITRRKSSVSDGQANAQMMAIAKTLQERYPETNGNRGAHLVGLQETLAGKSASGAWVLFAAVTFVYLIICANVANLLLTRAAGRRSEMAVRVAVGAQRGQLLRQMLTETVTLFLLGAVGGSVLAWWLVERLTLAIVRPEARHLVSLDPVALLFCLGICILSGIVIGLTPAFAVSSTEPHGILKASAARATGHASHNRVRSGLVIAQIAFAFALLAGCGLMLRAYAKLSAVPPGFAADGVVAASITVPASRDEAQLVTFQQKALAAAQQLSGVDSAAVVSTLPMSGSNSNSHFGVEGRPPWRPGEGPLLERHAITPGYFHTMGIPVLRGRDFTSADAVGSRRVLILSQKAASNIFPGEDPIGHRIAWGDEDGQPTWREIVGIVGDVRHRGLNASIANDGYTPFAQDPLFMMSIVVKTRREAAFGQDLSEALFRIDPEQAIWRTRTMQSMVDRSIEQDRSQTALLGLFAAAALFLAVVGLFALISYSTGQRMREFAIRTALGSTASGIVTLVMRGGFRLVGAGLGVGLAGALLVGRVLASRIPGVASFDIGIFGVIPALLAAASVLACLLPAWRAIRVPPASVLRAE